MASRRRQRRARPGDGRPRTIEVVRKPSQTPFRWTRRLLAQLGKVTDQALARKAGVHKKTVYEERHRRGIPAYRRLRPRVEWTDEMIAELGRDTDRNVAAVLDVHVASVRRKRVLLGIPSFTAQEPRGLEPRHWTQKELALLGTRSDYEIAELVGVAPGTVQFKRTLLGIPPFGRRPEKIVWTKQMLSLLGKVNDSEIAERFGVNPSSVKIKRDRLRIPPFVDKRGVVATAELLELIRNPSVEVTELTGLKAATIQKLRLEHGIQGRDGRFRWTPELIARLGHERDEDIARDLGVTESAVGVKRRSLHIPPPVRPVRRWTATEGALLGTAPDEEVAARLGRTVGSVAMQRIIRGIPRFGGAGVGGRPRRR